ncbi:relaxase/mobilization nuclease domain-containing protein [Dysgonomonas sp. Marseille-P4361]|uniref:relaxase/mobilization nuclease domain-containing protein n=1 Tax=Dysgonomonas sp. Marseille-P4361 TaxID=2161820 RepID=UPI000D552A07|nr:relaxase/mobilization nuclease domain-containing protein [Dysgonomonas sp. Marseille-P4361]
MIGKIVKGKSFKGCISYVMEAKDTKVLATEGVLETDTESIINSFYMQSLLNPKLSKCVGHIPLAFSPEDKERMTDHFMGQLAKEYMKLMGIDNTQYIVVRHSNTNHPHCHIVFNRVDNDGKTISDKNDRYRNEKVCKQLKDKYNLTYGQGKENVNVQQLKGAEHTKHEIYHAIKTTLLMTKDWEQFEHIINLQDISIQYKMKGQTEEVQGISFKKGDYSFKGSEMDRKFSYSKLRNQIDSKSQNISFTPQKKVQLQQSSSVLEQVASVTAFEQHGDDVQEEAFKERMEYEENKRQSIKKKKRRGFGL